jgi:hypothetical protein
MALRAVIDHPKSADLKVLLGGVPRHVVLGLLESIWHFCGRYTPQGNIGKYTDRQIESWVEWNGESGRLIRALIDAHWLDEDERYRLIVHDWDQHADEATKKALQRAHLPFVSTVSRQRPDMSRPPEPEPEPEPEYIPEPEPETQTVSTIVEEPAKATAPKDCVREMPSGLEDFEHWWHGWSHVKGTNHRKQAFTAWLTIVREAHLPDVYACTASYLAGLENPAKGYNPENFLRDQARDGFTARWPPKRAGPVSFTELRKQESNREFQRWIEEDLERVQRKIQSA